MFKRNTLFLALVLLCVITPVIGQTPYSLFLKAGELASDDLTTTENITVNELKNSLFGDTYYVILQFSEVPDSLQRINLEKQGIDLYTPIPRNAYLAAIPVTVDIQAIPARAVFVLEGEHKLNEDLARGVIPSYAYEGENIRLAVSSYPGITEASLLNAFAEDGFNAKVKEGYFVVRLSPSRLKELAARPYVMYLEPLAPEPEPEGLRSLSNGRANRLGIGTEANLGGLNVSLAIADDGGVSHADLLGRIIDNTVTNNGIHGDMTSGIAVGNGNLDPNARGFAPKATLFLYDIADYEHIYAAVDNYAIFRTAITSTSYGEGCGGLYTVNTTFIDEQVYNNTNLLHVFSAGNSSTSSCSNLYGKVKTPEGLYFGNITGGMKAGKNVLTIGNVEYNDYLQIRSSRGPTLDGRIKPDICAPGQGTYTISENNQYQIGGGTSAAAPAVAGISALLYEAHRRQSNSADPSSALIKGLLLGTADDLGRPGPDYEFGWGRVNAQKAYETLQAKQYIIGQVKNGQSNKHTVNIPTGTKKLRVMLYWHDAPGAVLSSRALINDLDLTVNTPDGITRQPLVLSVNASLSELTSPAKPGKDRVNNAEQVVIDNPVAGSYSLTVEGYELLSGKQEYYLVYVFDKEEIRVTAPGNGIPLLPAAETTVYWDALGNTGAFTLEYSRNNGQSWHTIAQNIPGAQRHFDWVVPSMASGQVRVRVRRGDTQATGDAFTVMDVPDFTVSYNDNQSAKISWTNVSGAAGYDVYMLGDREMEIIGSTTENSFVVNGLEAWEEAWFSVRAKNPQTEAIGQRAKAKQYIQKSCEQEITIKLRFDYYPSETSWEIISEDGKVLSTGGPYAEQLSNQQLDITECLPAGCFTFRIQDGFGDGICCSNGDGYYEILDAAGEKLASGGKFNKIETRQFCLQNKSSLTASIIEERGISCNGNTNGRLRVEVEGGGGNYTYQWNNGLATPTIQNLAAGIYAVTITDGANQRIVSYELEEPQAMQLSVFEDAPSCADKTDGALQTAISGGKAPYQYFWSNGENTDRIEELGGGAYQLTVTDANGCLTQQKVTLEAPPPVTVELALQQPTCEAPGTGAIAVSAIGGSGPYSYQWSNGATSKNVQNLTEGVYSFTLTDDNACTYQQTVRIQEPVAPIIRVEKEDVNCLNDGGRARVFIDGNAATTVLWSTGSKEQEITQLGAGDYSVVVTGENGCTTETDISIEAAPTVAIDLLETAPKCNGGEDGAVSIQVQNGQAPFSYQWSNGARTAALRNVKAGTYAVTITDDRGCIAVESTQLTEPLPIRLNEAVKDAGCQGESDGQIRLAPAGGLQPYVVQWENGSTGNQRNNLAPGAYAFTVTDAGGCTETAVLDVNEQATFDISDIAENPSCFDTKDGAINLTVTGTTGSFTYEWENGSTATERNNLSEGTYRVTVTDQSGCERSLTTTLTAPDSLQLQLTAKQPDCDNKNGKLTALVSGGNSSYSYHWSTGSSTRPVLSNLPGGTYDLTVTDAAGCEVTATAELQAAEAIKLELLTINPDCHASANGTIAAQVSGGAGTYTYNWSNGQNNAIISELTAGVYGVTVSDAANCVREATAQLVQPAALSVEETVEHPLCAESTDGSVQLQVTGGNGTYAVRWQHTNLDESDLSGLAAGTYAYTVTDDKSCSYAAQLSLVAPPAIDTDVSVLDPGCAGAADGIIDILPSGGTGALQLSWADGSAGTYRDELAAGVYQTTISDANSCKKAISINMTAPEPLQVDAHVQLEESKSQAQIILNTSGGTAPYEYKWSTGATSSEITAVDSGNYGLTVTDANGCRWSDAFPVNVVSNQYCLHRGNSTRFEWIQSVGIGEITTHSGNDEGYGDYTDEVIELDATQEVELRLEPAFVGNAYAENWYVWIDWNQNNSFEDPGEMIFNGTGKNLVTASFSVPEVPNGFETRIRVAMRFVPLEKSCGDFPYGEVEDYAVRFLNSNAETPPTELGDLCTAIGTISQYEWINAVKSGTMTNVSGNDKGYGDYRAKEIQIAKGNDLDLELSAGYVGSERGEFWVIWLDKNRDDVLTDDEELYAANVTEKVHQASIKLPETLASGKYNLRISMRWGLKAEPCENFYYGEIEDYTLVVSNQLIPTKEPLNPEGLDLVSNPGRGEADYISALFPNPNTGTFTVRLNSSAATILSLKVMDVNGRILLEEDWQLYKGDNRKAIQLQGLSPGIYTLRLGGALQWFSVF